MEQTESECDNKSLGSEEDFNLNCQPCYRDGDDVRAHGYCIECEEHLCVTCYKFHRRTVFTRDHTLLDTLSMPRKAVTTVKSPTKSSGQTDACTEECSDHKNKYIEYYCHLPKYLGCSVCVILNHKQCDSVRFIPDIVDKNEVHASFVQTIDSLSLEFKEIKIVSETNASEAKAIHNKAKQDKDGFRKVINSKLDLLDGDIENEMKSILKEDTKAMDDIKEMSDKRIKQLESVLSDTDDKHKVGQACNVFIAIKRVEDDIVSFTDDLKTLQQRNTIRKYKFKPDDQLLELMSGHPIGMLLQPSKCKQECGAGVSPENEPTYPNISWSVTRTETDEDSSDEKKGLRPQLKRVLTRRTERSDQDKLSPYVQMENVHKDSTTDSIKADLFCKGFPIPPPLIVYQKGMTKALLICESPEDAVKLYRFDGLSQYKFIYPLTQSSNRFTITASINDTGRKYLEDKTFLKHLEND